MRTHNIPLSIYPNTIMSAAMGFVLLGGLKNKFEVAEVNEPSATKVLLYTFSTRSVDLFNICTMQNS